VEQTFKTVQWSEGEKISLSKIEQMAINSDIIHQEILKRPMGVLARKSYIGADKAGTSEIFNFTFTIPSGRYIKMSMKASIKPTSVNTTITLRLENSGASAVYMELYCLDGNNGVSTSVADYAASRVMYAQPGTYTMYYRVYGTGGVSGASDSLSSCFAVVEDIGPGAKMSADKLGALV